MKAELIVQDQEDEVAVTSLKADELTILRQKAELDLQITTAKAFPRNVEVALKNMLFTATMDIETAEKCTYALPRGGKAITGKSIGLARICLQAWGNMRGEAKIINAADRYVESEAIAWDLEANVAVKVTVKRSIMQNEYGQDGKRTGKMIRMNDDMITVTGNALNSISLRNAVFNVIPTAITDKVYLASQAKIIGDMENYSRRLKKVVEGFKTAYGKSEKEVLALVGKTEVKQIKPEDLVVLIGVATALKDGDAVIENVFKAPVKTADDKKADLKNKQAAAKEVKAEEVKTEEQAAETKTVSEEPKLPTAEVKTGSDLFNAQQMP